MKHLNFFGLTIFFIGAFVNASSAETWNCGPKTGSVYSDSVKCTYDEASKTLTISGEGPMGNYAITSGDGSSAPWYGKDIVHAVIEGNVTSIGGRVFKKAYNLQDIKGTENITSVGYAAFVAAQSLKSIDLPNVQEIHGVAFLGSGVEYINIPENVIFRTDGDDRGFFQGTSIPNCDKTGECGSCGDKFVQAGVGCVSDCFDGYYPTNQGYCEIIKLRYTLPEADAATSNDNENMIEWIFE